MPRKLTRTLRRWLYIGHRWIGIVTCLLFAMWFISGVVMMYVAFPGLTDTERLAALPDLAWEKIVLSPDRAMSAAGATRYPRDLRLNMLADEPVYRLTGWDGKRQTVSAVDGRAVTEISEAQAIDVAARHAASKVPHLEDTVDRDQWSVTARYDPLRPLYLIALGDDAGTRLYVSSRTGEIVLDTNRTERVWNWLGSIPHWIYPTVLRQDGALWRSVVLWISGVCMIVAVSGIWIGILRVRLKRRYAGGSISPYRGWMAWHHVIGLFSGVFVLTWIFSGWMSLDPGRYFASGRTTEAALQRYAGHDAPTIAATVPALPDSHAVEARFVWLDGQPQMLLAARDGQQTVADPVTGRAASLPPDRIQRAAAHLLPEAHIVRRALLTQYDAYWYAHHDDRELPVLRVVFDDAADTWFHLSPVTGDILYRIDSTRRGYRWVFSALHSLDLQILITHRPAWDIVVWLLSIAGTIVSVSGVVIGWRYLKR
ncbi:MAG: PepSY domain-containing protein [Tardiphaga sp.]